MDLQSVVDWVRRQPKGAELLEQPAESSDLDQRRVWAEEIAAAKRELSSTGTVLLNAEQQKLTELEQVRERHARELEQARRPYIEAHELTEQLKARCSRIITSAECDLMRTASPRINEFARILEQRRNSIVPETRMGTSLAGDRVVAESNDRTRHAAVDRLNEIICRDLKQLALEPLDDEQLTERFAELERSVPVVELEKVR